MRTPSDGPTSLRAAVCATSAQAADPARALVDRHERTLSDAQRDAGAHYTPPALAAALVELGWDALGRPPRRVLDPSCGAGALLLAAADRFRRDGLDPGEIVEERLLGVDVELDACRAARAALRRWASQHGVRRPVHPRVVHADALLGSLPGGSGGVDLVVGNPPFLDQLDRRSARGATLREQLSDRYGALGPYCDTAGLFLLGAVSSVEAGGVVAMLQPQSFLGARDTAALRARLLEHADLVALWSADGHPFDAHVQVCAPILRVRRTDQAPSGTVRVRWGLEVEVRPDAAAPVGADGWAALLAPADLPSVELADGPTLGSIASGSAGFREEFYALSAAAVEEPGHVRRLVTVGMIDPFTCHWGRREFRLGGRRWQHPTLDVVALESDAPKVADWVRRRRGPKVLVSSQSRIPEAVVDDVGLDVPVTPVVSLQPLPVEGAVSVWHLAAAVGAPPAAALGVRRRLGTGMSSASVRWSVTDLLALPLPCERAPWDRAMMLARRLHAPHRDDALLAEFAVEMCRAHRLEADHDVVEWWTREVRRRLGPLGQRALA